MKKYYVIMVALFLVNGAMAQWFSQNSGTTNWLNSVYFTDVNTGYAVGNMGTIIKTSDGGANWTFQNSGTNQNLRSVFFTGEETGYAVGDSGLILKTILGGTEWTILDTVVTSNLNSVYFTDANTGYVVGESGTILKTINSGAIWSILTSNTFIDLNSVHFPVADTGYVVGDDKFLRTTNGGNNWEVQTLSIAYIYAVFFTNKNTGYVLGSGNEGYAGVLFTSDAGINWYSLNFPYWFPPLPLHSIYFTDENNGYVVGSDIFKTSDGGNNWTDQSVLGNYLHKSVFFPVSDTGYIVGYSGFIFKTTNGGLPVRINDQSLTSNALKISPTPSSTAITISTPTTPNKNTTLTIFNFNGQQLIQRQIKEQETVVNISGLSQGVYFVRVADDKTVQVGKFIKQ